MRTFPVLPSFRRETEPCPSSIPWEMIEPCEKQALINHGQSLERLAERQGLAPTEILAVLDGIRYLDLNKKYKNSSEARAELTRRVNDWNKNNRILEIENLTAEIARLNDVINKQNAELAKYRELSKL